MSKVVVQAFGLSLDGFSAGADQSLENPPGVHGPEMMKWVLPYKNVHRLGNGEQLFTGIDPQSLGYGATDSVAGERATHVTISRKD